MAIGNGELMHECFPKHSRMGVRFVCLPSRIKNSKNEITQRKTKKLIKKTGVSMERSKPETKRRSPDGLSLPNRNAIIRKSA